MGVRGIWGMESVVRREIANIIRQLRREAKKKAGN